MTRSGRRAESSSLAVCAIVCHGAGAPGMSRLLAAAVVASMRRRSPKTLLPTSRDAAGQTRSAITGSSARSLSGAGSSSANAVGAPRMPTRRWSTSRRHAAAPGCGRNGRKRSRSPWLTTASRSTFSIRTLVTSEGSLRHLAQEPPAAELCPPAVF